MIRKEDYRYFTYGRRVLYDGQQWELRGSMSENVDGMVPAVCAEDVRRHELLTAWKHNHVGLTPEQEAELAGLVHLIPCEACEPADIVRFIDPSYRELFRVTSGDRISVNGDVYRVFSLDTGAYHIAITDGEGRVAGKTLGSCFHICEFAEIAQRRGWHVAPVEQA